MRRPRPPRGCRAIGKKNVENARENDLQQQLIPTTLTNIATVVLVVILLRIYQLQQETSDGNFIHVSQAQFIIAKLSALHNRDTECYRGINKKKTEEKARKKPPVLKSRTV
jgi:hypothetical protein